MLVTTAQINGHRGINKIKCQAGQALPLGIALLLFSTLFTLVLFSSGQLTTVKSRLANAADSAAYSGLIWQARALNFSAYTNRAMVANQVSIAQFVSMNSWSRYGLDLAEQTDTYIGPIPFFKPYTATIKNYATLLNDIVGTIASHVVPIIDIVNEAISSSQEFVYYASFLATPEIVEDVVVANDHSFKVDSAYSLASMATHLTQWKRFTKRYGVHGNSGSDSSSNNDHSDGGNNSNNRSGSNVMKGIARKVAVIENSRDSFSRDRGWNKGTFAIDPTNKVTIVKEGSTRLREIDGEYSWMGKDAMALKGKKYVCSWPDGCRWKSYDVAVAGGGAFASEDYCAKSQQNGANNGEPYNNASQSGDREDDDHCYFLEGVSKAEERANDRMEDINGYGGVKAYRDLTDLSAENRDPRLKLRVKVHIDSRNIKTSSAIANLGSDTAPSVAARNHGIGPGMYWAGEETASGVVASVSSAELFFKRPDEQERFEQGKQKEYGSLYNPYWQVRLTNTSKAQLLAAWTSQDSAVPLATASGLADGATNYGAQQQRENQQLTQLQVYSDTQAADFVNLLAMQTELGSTLQTVNDQIAITEASISTLEAAGESADVVVDTVSQYSNLVQAEESAAGLVAAVHTASNAVLEEDDQVSGLLEDISVLQSEGAEVTAQLIAHQALLDNLQAQEMSLEAQLATLAQSVVAAEAAQIVVTELENYVPEYSDYYEEYGEYRKDIASYPAFQEWQETSAEEASEYGENSEATAREAISRYGKAATDIIGDGTVSEGFLAAGFNRMGSDAGSDPFGEVEQISVDWSEFKTSVDVAEEEYHSSSEAIAGAQDIAKATVMDLADLTGGGADDSSKANHQESSEENSNDDTAYTGFDDEEIEDAVAREMQAATAAAEEIIRKQKRDRDSEIIRVEEVLNDDISALSEKIENYDSNINTPEDKAAWEVSRRRKQDALITRPIEIQAEYQSRIDLLNKEMAAFTATHPENVAQVKADLAADIIGLQQAMQDIVAE